MEDISMSLISAVEEGKLERVKEIIEAYGLSYSEAWSEGYVLLCFAMKRRHREIAKLLLLNGSKVNRENEDLSNTPLYLAIKNYDEEIVRMLLDRDADVKAKNKHCSTALHISFLWTWDKSGYLPRLLLNSGADPNVSDNDGVMPLHIAANKGHLQAVKDLVKHGAYINSVFVKGSQLEYTPLHFACAPKKDYYEFVSEGALSNFSYTTDLMKDYFHPQNIGSENDYAGVVKLLLAHGANVNTQNKDKQSALHLAVRKGNLMIIEEILKYSPDVNNRNNRSSLNAAVLRDGEIYRTITKKLLEYGFIVDNENVSYSKVLHAAVRYGYPQIFKDLLDCGADVNMSHESTREKGYTTLHCATAHLQYEIVEVLINNEANVNAKDETGRTPIYYAFGNIKIFKLLLTKGANVKDSPELLHFAVKHQLKEIVELLLQHDVDINASDENGRTALHYTALNSAGFSLPPAFRRRVSRSPLSKISSFLFYAPCCCPPVGSALIKGAASQTYPAPSGGARPRFPQKPVLALNEDFVISDSKVKAEIARLLLSNGAYVDAQTNNGLSALQGCIMNGFTEVAEVLLEYNANVNIGEKLPLHLSARQRDPAIIKMLLNKGADINAKQKDGKTALHIATQHNHRDIVEALLESGADVDPKVDGYFTPLLIAVQYCYKGNLLVGLLEFGADIHARDDQDRTALHIACTIGYDNIVEILLNYGSDVNIRSENNTPLDAAIAGFSIIDDPKCNLRIKLIQYEKYEKIVTLLKKHIIKMKAANLYVNERNLSSISNEDNLSQFQQTCEQELESMKNEKIGDSNLSFHDFLTDNTNKLAIYLRDENIVKVITSHDFQSKFQIYAAMIRNYFKKGMQRKERKELLEPCHAIFNSLFNVFPQLPYICIEKIFSFLSNRDIIFFINTCKPTNSSSDDVKK